MNTVSIIITCFNYGRYLADAINSCLEQSYPPLEVIIVNDGSTDNTAEVADSFKNTKIPIFYIKQENKGLSSARNAGCRIANGNYLLNLDADDKINIDFIKKTIGVDDIVGTWLQEFGDSNVIWKSLKVYPQAEDFLKNNHLNCCSLFKKEVFDRTGGYDENMKSGYEDWEFWMRATKAGYECTVIQEVLFYYRKHGKSMIDIAKEKHNEILNYILTKNAI